MSDPLAFRLRLDGAWWDIDLESGTRASIDRMLRATIGRRDEDAAARARARRDVLAAAAHARAGGAVALAIATRLPARIPAPVVLTVFPAERIHVAPAVGTTAAAVLDALEHAATARHGASVARRPAAGTPALRTHRVVESQGPQGAEAGLEARRLVAEYWVPVPDTKHVALVALATPLADIPHAVLDLFDAVMAAAVFDRERVEDRGRERLA